MEKQKPITITDIAKNLGISPSTVSRALHDHPSISVDTKREVKALAEKLNYQPNLTALSLLSKKSGLIGVVIPEITSYFFSTVIAGIQDVVSSAGYKLIISQTNESFEEEKRMIFEMTQLRVDGILVSPSFATQTFDHFNPIKQAGIPVVIFDRDCPGFDANKVFVDAYEGAFQAVDYLVKSGCQNIAHIAGPVAIPTFKQRLDGYLDALQQNGREINEDLIVFSTGFSSEVGVESIEKLLDQNKQIDAVFAVNDAVAIGTMHSLREKGYKIPEDVAIIGFDDEPYATFFNPPLASVWQPVYDMGMLSSKILLDLIKPQKVNAPYRYEILKSELVIRDSCVQ